MQIDGNLRKNFLMDDYIRQMAITRNLVKATVHFRLFTSSQSVES
jgi:hypothetical protein